jgi:transcriptional antiterminator RfaH
MSAEASLGSIAVTHALAEVDPSSGRWFVGHTLPRKEYLAQIHLERQGFRTFFPRTLSIRRHARKAEHFKAALFPRYLFIHLDLTRDRWRSINSTIGMAYLVTTCETPCPAPSGFVEALISADCRDSFIETAPEFSPGDTARFTTGPFEGQLGEMLRLDANGRVDLLVRLLNGVVRINVAQAWLEPVE